jgi:hypothetical protein
LSGFADVEPLLDYTAEEDGCADVGAGELGID